MYLHVSYVKKSLFPYLQFATNRMSISKKMRPWELVEKGSLNRNTRYYYPFKLNTWCVNIMSLHDFISNWEPYPSFSCIIMGVGGGYTLKLIKFLVYIRMLQDLFYFKAEYFGQFFHICMKLKLFDCVLLTIKKIANL